MSLYEGRGHHESDAEFYGRIAVPVSEPRKEASMQVKVSIPVEVGAYTGQRDAWESFQTDYNVVIDDDGRVLLESTGPGKRKIWLDLEDLQKAVKFARQEGGTR